MRRIDGWNHVFRRSNGSLYYVRRVPNDVEAFVKEAQFRRSLKHRDERSPAFKAAYDAVHGEVDALIGKVRRGLDGPEAVRHYETAVLRAQKLGFDYRPMSDLANGTAAIDDVLARLEAVEARVADKGDHSVDAVLGAVKRPSFSIEDALEIFADDHKTELRGKNPNQRMRWRNPLDLAIRNFVGVVGSKALDEITRDDALKFREWWVEERIGRDVSSANTANKNLMALRKIFRVVNDLHRLGLDNPFDGLRVSGSSATPRVSLTREWLEQTMLTVYALAGLNTEAAGVALAMADTGARVNEITGLEPADIILDARVPHILIRPNITRSLKTAHSERTIPLVGAALKALREHPDGFPRYAGKNAQASAVVLSEQIGLRRSGQFHSLHS